MSPELIKSSAYPTEPVHAGEVNAPQNIPSPRRFEPFSQLGDRVRQTVDHKINGWNAGRVIFTTAVALAGSVQAVEETQAHDLIIPTSNEHQLNPSQTLSEEAIFTLAGGEAPEGGNPNPQVESLKKSQKKKKNHKNKKRNHPPRRGNHPPKHTDTRPYEIKPLYVRANDTIDRNLNTNGTLETSLAAAQNLTYSQTGMVFRMATENGRPDIDEVVLPQSEAYYYGTDGRYLLDALATGIHDQGYNDDHTLYLLFYDGTKAASCGAGMIPSQSQGHTVGVFPQAEYISKEGNPVDCSTVPFSNDPAKSDYQERATVHEILHGVGAVDPDAPHFNIQNPHHVTDDLDILTGGKYLQSSFFDIGHDDYYGENVPQNAINVQNSVFMTGGGREVPPGWHGREKKDQPHKKQKGKKKNQGKGGHGKGKHGKHKNNNKQRHAQMSFIHDDEETTFQLAA